MIIAATNRPETLDPAIMRPGRFDRLLYVPLPDAEARAAILRRTLGKMRCEFCVDGSGGEGDFFVNVELVEKTEGFSGAEIVNVCTEAGMAAVRERVGGDEESVPVGGARGAKKELMLSKEHLLSVLLTAKPRISPDAIRFYDDFEKSRA